MADKKTGVSADNVMSAAEMRPLLLKSKAEPVHCALGLSDAREAVLLLDRKVGSRRLLAELEKKAKSVKLGMDHASLRFGSAAVDVDVDATLVRFVINRALAGAVEEKLRHRLKGAGFLKAEIVVDDALDVAEPPAPPPPPPPDLVRAVPVQNVAPPVPARTGAAVALAKSVLLWDATRKELMDQLHLLEAAILAQSAGEDDFEEILESVPVLADVLAELDTRLSDTLNAIYATTDQAERARLREQAKAVVVEYETYIAAEPLMAALDSNPFVPFDASAKVRLTLSAIASTL